MQRIFANTLLMAAFFITTASGQTFEVEKNHCTIEFSIPIAGGLTKVTGKFTDFDITIMYDENELSRSTVTATIKAHSIDTGIDGRDKDLCKPVFFDVEKYPEITFKSTRILKRGEENIAVGDLTMRGVVKEIELPFTVTKARLKPNDNSVLGISAQCKFNRQDFGVGSTFKHTMVDNLIGDEVTITIDLWTK